MKPQMMLAAVYKPSKAGFPMWAEPKLDGYRFWILFASDGFQILQRSGADYTERLGFIAEQIAPTANRLYPDGVILDGEMMAGQSWGETTTLVKTERDIDRSALMFYAFDLVTPNNGRSLSERKASLEVLVQEAKNDGATNVSVTLHVEVKDQSQVDAVFTKFCENGFEGAMIKDPNAKYIAGRSVGWQKYKPWTSTDGKIIGFEVGKNRLSNTLGAIKLMMPDGSQVDVGTGLKDKQRDEIWAQREEYMGRWVEFKHQKDTTEVAEYRFPVFLRFRSDMDEAEQGVA